MPLIEVYGYIGSALIAISLMMSNILWLRWINLVGAAIFSSYGIIIEAWPVAFLNGFIVLIDIYHLIKIYRQPKESKTARFQVDNPYVQQVLSLKWPQIAEMDKKGEIEVIFKDHQPVQFTPVTH